MMMIIIIIIIIMIIILIMIIIIIIIMIIHNIYPLILRLKRTKRDSQPASQSVRYKLFYFDLIDRKDYSSAAPTKKSSWKVLSCQFQSPMSHCFIRHVKT